MTNVSPLDMLLMNYAAGRLGAQESLLVASYLTLNVDARRKVSQYEAYGAQLMCEAEPAPVHAECLSAVMSRIEKKDKAGPCGEARPCAADPNVLIPATIYTLFASVCRMYDPRHWSTVTRGFSTIDLRLEACPREDKRLRLMKLEPGQAAPPHAHDGAEITLVLQGSFRDQTGRYQKGDVVIITDPRFVHQPVAENQGCVCLTLNDGPLRFQDPLRRFMNTFWRV